MNVPTDLLSIFKRHNGTQTLDDGVLEIPHALLPVLEIPEIDRASFYGDQGSTPRRQSSFRWSGSIQRTNQAGVTEFIGVGAGIWEFHVAWQYVANYTDIPNVGGFYFALGSSGQDFQIAVGRPIANVPQTGYYTFRIAIEAQDEFAFIAIVNTNGVGETDFFNYTVHANRLG